MSFFSGFPFGGMGGGHGGHGDEDGTSILS